MTIDKKSRRSLLQMGWRSAGVVHGEREVRTVDQPIGKPMRKDSRAEDEAGDGVAAADGEIQQPAAHRRPGQCAQQAVGEGHVEQVKWASRHQSGDDAGLFDACEDEDRPEEVDELGGVEEGPEGNFRGIGFGGECSAIEWPTNIAAGDHFTVAVTRMLLFSSVHP